MSSWPWRAAMALCLALGVSLASATPSAAPPRSAIPFKQDKPGGDHLPYQSLAGVVLAGLAAYGIVLGLKHLRAKGGLQLGKSKLVHTLEVTRLSRESVLYVIEYQGQQLLLAEGKHGVQLLSQGLVPAASKGDSDA